MLQPKLKIRGKDMAVPALSFDNMERIDKDGTLDKLPINSGAFGVPAARQAAAEILRIALSQEMPDVAIEDVTSALTTQNVVPVVVLWCLNIPEESVKRADADIARRLAASDAEPAAEASPGEAERP